MQTESRKKKVLLTNDDGWDHPAFQALYNYMKDLFDVVVVAPAKEHSSSGCKITIFDAIKIVETKKNFFVVHGTPVDSVLFGVCEFKPDIVISGPNPHPTVGPDVFRSSTLACAIQAGYLRIPAAAISLFSNNIKTSFDCRGNGEDFVQACKIAEFLCETELMKAGIVWNVNVHTSAKWPEDAVFTKCSTNDFGDKFHLIGTDVRNEKWYRISYMSRVNHGAVKVPVTDEDALNSNKISFTPLSIDMTYYEELGKARFNLK